MQRLTKRSSRLYFDLISSDLLIHFYNLYLSKDLDLIWRRLDGFSRALPLDKALSSPGYELESAFYKLLSFCCKKGYCNILDSLLTDRNLSKPAAEYKKNIQGSITSYYKFSLGVIAVENDQLQVLEWLTRNRWLLVRYLGDVGEPDRSLIDIAYRLGKIEIVRNLNHLNLYNGPFSNHHKSRKPL